MGAIVVFTDVQPVSVNISKNVFQCVQKITNFNLFVINLLLQSKILDLSLFELSGKYQSGRFL